ncbi:unnamed protein product, partial [Polarella glacialis]
AWSLRWSSLRIPREAVEELRMASPQRRPKIRPGPHVTWEKLKPFKEMFKDPAPKSPEDLEQEKHLQIMRTFTKDGLWEEAVAHLKVMEAEGVPRVLAVWKFAVKACSQAGQWQEATRLLNAMFDAKERVAPDHSCFHAAMDACEVEGKMQPEALLHPRELLKQMQLRGLMPTAFSYAKVLKMFMDSGNRKEAEALYAEVTRQGLLSVWHNGGNILDLQDVDIAVAQVVIRFAVEERASNIARARAGRGGFVVITGKSSKSEAHKQHAVIRIMKEEYGLKVRVDPAKFGRLRVRTEELERLGKERLAKEEAR